MKDESRKQNVNLSPAHHIATFAVDSANDADRTVDVVWSTAQKILFYSYDLGDHYLTLGLDPENVRLDFLNSGAPVLDAHQNWDIASVKGRVESASVNGTEGRARLRFSKRAEVDSVWADIRDGILPFVSVGTRLHRLQDISESDDKIPHYLAVDHEPLEISIAPIPKDQGARMQSENGDGDTLLPCVIEYQQSAASRTKEVATMATNKKSAQKPSPEIVETAVEQAEATPKASVVAPEVEAQPEVTQSVDIDAIAKQAEEREFARGQSIRELVKKARLDAEFADELVAGKVTIEQARVKVLDRIAEEADKVETRSGVTVVADEGVIRVQSISNALEHRTAPGAVQLSDAGRSYMGLSLVELAREVCQAHGVQTRGLTRERVVEQALHSTSDFPLILSNVAGKTLTRAYTESPKTFPAWAREASAPDFKTIQRTSLGEAPALEVVTENGEFKHGTIGEYAESYKLATYGKIVSFTRQAIVNDDLSAFSRIMELHGRAGARLESDVVYGILTANAAMADGNALFHANHSNLTGTGTAITVTSLGIARALMRKQTGRGGTAILNLSPRTLLLPAALETIGQNYITQNIVGTKASDTNPFVGAFSLVVEPRLDADSAVSWYLIADSGEVDTIEYCYLEGQRGMFQEMRNGFDVDGIEFKARLDFAAKAIDWRGMYKNNGA